MEKKAQTNFSKGELSDLIGARPDLAAYQNGASILENVIVIPEGGVTRDHTATLWIQGTKFNGLRSILIPFVFNMAQAYQLEVGNGYVRVFRADLTFVLELVTPWLEGDLADLQWKQSADVLYVVHGNYQQRQINRLWDTNWTVTLFETDPPPSHVPDTIISFTATLTPAATTGVGINFHASEAVFFAGDVGRHIKFGQARGIITTVSDDDDVIVRILSAFPDTNPIPAGEWVLTGSPGTTLNPDSRGPVGSIVNLVAGVNAFRSEDNLKFIKIWGGVVQIVTVTDPINIIGIINTELSNWDTSENPDAALAGTWTLEIASWSDALGWPSVVEFHQGRLGMFFTDEFPTTHWLSAVDDYPNFGTGAAADSAIEYTVASRRVNRGQWAVSLGSLFFGDGEAEHSAKGPGVDSPLGGDVIPFIEDVSQKGAIHHQPLVVDKSVLFINHFRNKIWELSYVFDNNNDGFNSKNRTLLARQIGVYKFSQHPPVFAQEPDSIAYFILDNGHLACLTFNKDEEVIAWTRIVTDGFFESVSVIPGDTGSLVWVIVRRAVLVAGVLTTVRYLERFWHETQLHTHCGRTFNSLRGTVHIGGMEHLAGKTVDIVTNHYHGTAVVDSNGVVTLPLPLDKDSGVEIGLHYKSTIRTMRAAAPNAVTEGHKRHWTQVSVSLKDTIGGTINGKPLRVLNDNRPYTGPAFGNPTNSDYDGYLNYRAGSAARINCFGNCWSHRICGAYRMMIVPLTEAHFHAMDLPMDWLNKYRLLRGVKYAVIIDGQVAGIGGVAPDVSREAVGLAWTFFTEKTAASARLMRRLHAAVLAKLPEAKERFVRIECLTMPRSDKHYNWLLHFGFIFEGVAEKFTGLEDRARFAWIRSA